MSVKTRSITLTVFLVAGIGVAPSGRAQEEVAPTRRAESVTRPSEFGGRYDGFRLLWAGEDGRQPYLATIKEFEASRPDDWKRWVVVLLGDVSYLTRSTKPWQIYLNLGGRILIASDRELNTTDRRLPLSIDAGPVEVPPGPDAYQRRPLCPIVRVQGSHPVGHGVARLAFNRSGALRRVSRTDRLAVFPSSATTRGKPLPSYWAAAATYQVGDGRAIFVADQSPFLNEMLLELDNLTFAKNVVDWMKAGIEPSSMNVLFLEDGRAADRWVDPRFTSGDWRPPTLASLAKLADELLRGMEEENTFNESARAGNVFWSKGWPRASLLIAPAILAALFMALAWRRSRSWRPLPLPASGAQISPLERRRHWMRQRDDYTEAARHLAERYFSNTLDPNAPHSSGPRRRADRRMIAWMGRLLEGRDVPPVRWRKFVELRDWLELKEQSPDTSDS